ncbi:MAG: UDP-N-acetylmuramate dehydrogenase [Nitrincola sp.]|nr:UDP-N-acetylmuramate dehydrogenase [Nitrincola sp.]
MLSFDENVNLAALNTFGFGAIAEKFIQIESHEMLVALVDYCQHHQLPLLVLGGGSNLILAEKIPGIVALMALRGQELTQDNEHEVHLKVAAGENWHETVVSTLNQGLYGLENLALIPGTVGAAPMQNIGAYGVELKDRMFSLEALDRETLQFVTLKTSDCQFGYRDSLFKSICPEKYIIVSVTFALTRALDQLELSYLALKDTCERIAGQEKITPWHVFEAVCDLRRSKLPDPRRIGNVGSFFKNPKVSLNEYEHLKSEFPNLIGFPDAEGYKLAAGWLIEHCGWKGYQTEGVGVFEKQALVLINLGSGNRQQIAALAERIQDSVYQCFNVSLEVEPRFYP